MSILIFVALATAAPAVAEQPPDQRRCGAGLRGSSQLAYEPYGSAVFGSDGLTCSTVKADPRGGRTRGARKLSRPQVPELSARGLAQRP